MPPTAGDAGASETPPRIAIGMSLKRSLLDAAIADDPDPDGFEAWLLDCCLKRADALSPGALRAMARDILAEWQLAAVSTAFRDWLEAGAPSEDRAPLADPRSPTPAFLRQARRS